MRKLIRSQKGFTLIELLVVIGILATLAGVVLLGVTQFVNRGGTEANCADLHNVQTAAAACLVEVATGNAVPGTDCTTVAGLQAAGVLLSEPRCEYTIDPDGIVTGQTNCRTGEACIEVPAP